MKAKIESTAQIVIVDGVRCRIWLGETEAGVPFTALIHKIGMDPALPDDEFERDLMDVETPSDVSIAPWSTLMAEIKRAQ